MMALIVTMATLSIISTANQMVPSCGERLGTLRYGDYGLRLDARFSLAETLGRVHNE